MPRHHRITGAVTAVLLLVAGACGAAAGEEDLAGETVPAPVSTSTTTAATGTPAPPGTDDPRTQRLGSALYDPADHAREAVAPVSLAVPAVDVRDAPVEAVGVEAGGEMEIPAVDRVGWYRFGSGPGQAGTTVLAAHIAYDGVDGVFRSLDAAAAGDEVVVTSEDGTATTYRITGVEIYDKQALPAEVFASAGPERLALVTCGGSFNPELRSYDSNVVAWAVPIDPQPVG